MYLLHRNVTGLRANLDLAHTVAANKVQNHLNDNQNLLKEVNNLRFEVRNLSMENQRLGSQLEFNARMQGGRSKRPTDSQESSEMELMFPQYHQQQQQQQHPDHQYQQGQQNQSQGVLSKVPSARINWDAVPSVDSEDPPPASTAEMPSYDSNGNHTNNAAFFARLRDGSVNDASGRNRKGPKPAAKHVSKSASAPFFSVKGVHSDASVEGARNALGATVSGGAMYPEDRGLGRGSGVQQEFSTASKRTITGVPSYASYAPEGGGSLVSNKNEYQRSADDKIAALMEMNEQQIRAQYKPSSSSTSKGSKAKAIHMQSVTPDFSRGDVSLELLGGPVPFDGGIADGAALNFSLTSDGSSGVQLPNIRKNTLSGGFSKKK